MKLTSDDLEKLHASIARRRTPGPEDWTLTEDLFIAQHAGHICPSGELARQMAAHLGTDTRTGAAVRQRASSLGISLRPRKDRYAIQLRADLYHTAKREGEPEQVIEDALRAYLK